MDNPVFWKIPFKILGTFPVHLFIKIKRPWVVKRTYLSSDCCGAVATLRLHVTGSCKRSQNLGTTIVYQSIQN